MSSDCPRTDAALDALDEVQTGQIVGHGQTFIEFTRTLERELNQVGEMMVNAQNASVAIVKERDQLKQQLEAKFPDIGPDPLKADGDERKRLHNETDERLTKAFTIQQSGVPDQTALVWRIDISRQHDALIIAQTQREGLRQQLLASQLREHRLREWVENQSHSRDCLLKSLQNASAPCICGKDEALSTPSDSSALKEIREALESVDIINIYACDDDGLRIATAKAKAKHAITLLAGGKDK